MSKEKLNILSVPTFSSLGVNYAVREVKGYETEILDVKNRRDGEIVQYADSSSYPFRETKIDVPYGERIRLVQVFDRSESYVSKLHITLADRAELELVQLYIGGSDTVSEIVTELDGAGSKFSAVIGCALDNEDKLDINLAALHRGRKTESDISVGAVLRGNSQKTFKGTIDFKNGSSGAKGAEHEAALLLDNRVRNRTVPVILCEEENVEGSHGATVGRLDDKHVFYLRSRGLPEEKIYELMARSRLMNAVSRIGDLQTKARICGSLGWSDDNE